MTIQMEVKKHALQQLQDGLWKLTLTVHPSDMDLKLLEAPMGSVYGIAMVPIDYDNPGNDKIVKHAAMICKDINFQKFLMSVIPASSGIPTEDECAAFIRSRCDIKSRSELATNQEAQRKFREIHQQFREWSKPSVDDLYAEYLDDRD